MSSTAEVNRQWKQDQDEYATLRPVETEENQVLKNENKNSQVFHLAHFTSNNSHFLSKENICGKGLKPLLSFDLNSPSFSYMSFLQTKHSGFFSLRANNDIIQSKTKSFSNTASLQVIYSTPIDD